MGVTVLLWMIFSCLYWCWYFLDYYEHGSEILGILWSLV